MKYKVQRLILGILAAAMVAVGVIAVFAQLTHPLFPIVMRAGFVLLACWLAWPQLTQGRWRSSLAFVFGGILVVAILAARPRMLPIILAIIACAAVVHVALRSIIRAAGKPPRRKE
jgi:putative Ca2+/H+ antiporter (TMEM165/GDT1 family)